MVRPIEGETRLGMIGKYAHLITVHCFGGISRRGRTELVTFTGICNFRCLRKTINCFLQVEWIQITFVIFLRDF